VVVFFRWAVLRLLICRAVLLAAADLPFRATRVIRDLVAAPVVFRREDGGVAGAFTRTRGAFWVTPPSASRWINQAM